jgi:hypothetical protein
LRYFKFDRWIVGRIARSIPAMTLLTGALRIFLFKRASLADGARRARNP